MSDNQTTMTFPPDTLVWVKVYNRIWWPGKVVHPTTAPEEMQEFMHRKKNPIAMVFFERDKKYDIVINMDKISLYSCPNKMEYIRKGYILSLKEKKGTKIQNVEMENFKKDVIKFEEEINGNVNIFLELEKKDEERIPPPKDLIKELFVPSKVLEKKKSTKKPQVTNFKTPSKVKRNLHSPSPKNVQKSPVIKSHESPSSSPQILVCDLKLGCNFTTKRYETLKRHMALCKTIVEDEDKFELKSETKNKQRTTGKTYVKKPKIINDKIRTVRVTEKQYDEPGCSTMLTENNKDNDEITNIATNTTESIKNVEDSRTFEKDHDNSYVDSNDTNDIREELKEKQYDEPGCSTMLTENNKDNDEITNIATNTTESIKNVEDSRTFEKDHDNSYVDSNDTNDIREELNDVIIGFEETNEPQEKLNNSTDNSDDENDHSFDLDTGENRQSTVTFNKVDEKTFLKDILNGKLVAPLSFNNFDLRKDEATKEQNCFMDGFKMNAQWFYDNLPALHEVPQRNRLPEFSETVDDIIDPLVHDIEHGIKIHISKDTSIDDPNQGYTTKVHRLKVRNVKYSRLREGAKICYAEP